MAESGSGAGAGNMNQKSPVQPQPVVQNLRLAYGPDGTAIYMPVPITVASPTWLQSPAPGTEGSGSAGPTVIPQPAPVGININMVGTGRGRGRGRGTGIGRVSGSGSETHKRKRGRPRKYGPDMPQAMIPAPPPPVTVAPSTGGGDFSSPPAAPATSIAAPLAIAPAPPAATPAPAPAPAPAIAAPAPATPAPVISAPSPPPATPAPAIAIPLAIAPAPPAPASASAPPVAPAIPAVIRPPPSSPGASASSTKAGKPRGRPPGSANKKRKYGHKKLPIVDLGSDKSGVTPHVITVQAGEDISSRIISVSLHSPKAVCVLSATGSISNVTLCQSPSHGGTVTYEGWFNILSLTGSFVVSENGDQWSRAGGLNVTLSGPDGRILGGIVAGLLIAASAVQVILGTFISNGSKDLKSANNVKPLSAPSKLASGGGSTGASSPPSGASSPPSRGTSESSGGPGSPLNQSTAANDNPQSMAIIPFK